jgi:hypothetical protein
LPLAIHVNSCCDLQHVPKYSKTSVHLFQLMSEPIYIYGPSALVGGVKSAATCCLPCYCQVPALMRRWIVLGRGPELHLHSCTTAQFAQSPGPQLPKLFHFIKVISVSWSQTQGFCMPPIVEQNCVCALRSIIGNPTSAQRSQTSDTSSN